MRKVGDRIGPYVIDAVAGKGGMGVVYRAHDQLLGRRVALKVMLPDAHDDALARFVREARIAATLKHPHIAVVHEAQVVDDFAYIAFEWIEGESLRTKLARREVVRHQAIAWLRDVAEALAFAHERGVIHRDIKPANVMIDAEGVAKVIDFGAAKRVHTGRTTSPSPLTFDTDEGIVLGTPRYMAPEQVVGPDVDARADQFAWATMASETLGADVPAAFARIVERARSALRDERFPSMRALLAEWDRFGLATTLREGAPPGNPARRSRRFGVFAASALGTVIVGAAALGFWLRRSPERTAPDGGASPSPAPVVTAPPLVDRADAGPAEEDADAPKADGGRAARPSGFAADHGGTCRCWAGSFVDWEGTSEPIGFLCAPQQAGGTYADCYIPDGTPTNGRLCARFTPDAGDVCESYGFALPEGRPCRGSYWGFDKEEKAEGRTKQQLACRNLFTFAGRVGAPCQGLDRRRVLTKGVVHCGPGSSVPDLPP